MRNNRLSRKAYNLQAFNDWVIANDPDFKMQLWETFVIDYVNSGEIDENGYLVNAAEYYRPDFSKTRIWKLYARYRREHELQAE